MDREIKLKGDKVSKSNINKEDKALINLNENIYGTFENGAGQETVRHFFRSGSSGTIATMSAYDKDFSDAIYGIEDGRYVTESRQKNDYHGRPAN
jgi:hypothetical protein